MKKYSLTFLGSALLTYNCRLPPGLPVHWTIRLFHTNVPCPVFFSAHVINPAYPFHPQAVLACHYRQQLGYRLALYGSFSCNICCFFPLPHSRPCSYLPSLRRRSKAHQAALHSYRLSSGAVSQY